MSCGSSHKCSSRVVLVSFCCVLLLDSSASAICVTGSQQAGLGASVSKLLSGHSLLIRPVNGYEERIST